SGRWKFNKCNVRIKGNGTPKDEFKGSIGRVSYVPEFTDCSIVTPTGTEWKKLDKSGYIYYSLFANDKVVTDWVTIQPNGAETTYDLVLEEVGEREIAVIAIVKDITGIGMMAVKKLIATAPCIIKENMTEEEAKAARDRLLEVGAKASIYPHGTWKPTGISVQTIDAKESVIYTLQGVRLNAKFESLPAGVYIVNGKKVLKK
uniref:ribosomal protein L7/L12 n=1 Tax=Prevotella aurantiaca TaxID=596085 RepID=UPI0023552DFB